MFNIVLVAPDIPGNTGSIGRTCVALNLRLILIRPYGFEITEKALRRAGLDYWQHVQLTEYSDFENFLKQEQCDQKKLFFFTKTAETVYYQAQFSNDCYLIFGSETKGLPQDILSKYRQDCYKLPMYTDKIRSLNLSNTACSVAYECLRQINFS